MLIHSLCTVSVEFFSDQYLMFADIKCFVLYINLNRQAYGVYPLIHFNFVRRRWHVNIRWFFHGSDGFSFSQPRTTRSNGIFNGGYTYRRTHFSLFLAFVIGSMQMFEIVEKRAVSDFPLCKMELAWISCTLEIRHASRMRRKHSKFGISNKR